MITLPQPAGLFVATGLAMLTLFLALASAQLLLRADRRRRARRGGPARRLLFALAAGDQEAADKLVRLPTRTWHAAEQTAVALVGEVRGEARDALLEVFERTRLVVITEAAEKRLERIDVPPHGLLRLLRFRRGFSPASVRNAAPILCFFKGGPRHAPAFSFRFHAD